MANNVYANIWGCPKHGSLHGRITKIIKKGDANQSKPCFVCDACNRVYVETSGLPLGDTKQTVSGYSVWNTKGPYKIPETVYIYELESSLCGCKGKVNKKMKAISLFLMPDGGVTGFNGNVCKKCGKVYIKKNVYKANEKTFNKYHSIKFVDLSGSTLRVIQKPQKDNNAQIQSSENEVEVEWKQVMENEDNEDSSPDLLSGLKPADRVASAYYDAKIRFNPYQYLPWLKMFIGGAKKILISDEVGLGKTIEAGILVSEELTENVNAKIIIVCPAFLREKWYQELHDKFMFDPQIFNGKSEIDSMANVMIVPVSRIDQYLENSMAPKYDVDMIVVDEVHYFKNSASKRYKSLRNLIRLSPNAKLVFMSATPVNNTGNDYHSIECLFGETPEKTNTTKKQSYITLPTRHIKEVFVDLTEDEQKVYNTTDRLDPFSGTIYRHIGASCLYALSRYAFQDEELSTETRDELRNALEELMDTMDIPDENIWINRLKTITLPETDTKLETLKEIISQFPDKSKIVIFSHYIETIKYIFSELSKTFNVGYIYANSISNNIPCRHLKNKFQDAKEWFENEKSTVTILICSDACKEGIDLDIANKMINYDLPFNPSILEQRIGRIDRMSQKSDMEIYNFHVNNTYDDRLHFILASKLRFINYYSNYGIGNPLNVTSGNSAVLSNFIRYFGAQIYDPHKNALMSNDDYYTIGKLLRKIGIRIDKRSDMNALKMQAILLDRLKDNKQEIIEWFSQNEIQKITDEELIRQKRKLEGLLGFPSKIQRKVLLSSQVIEALIKKANNNVAFRKRIAGLISDYDEKLNQMEITGNPMILYETDLKTEYVFGLEGQENRFVQGSVIELLRNEGADIYDIV